MNELFMRRFVLIVVAVLMGSFLFGQELVIKRESFPVKSIESYQRKCKFDFKMPQGFHEIPTLSQSHLKYDLNLRNDAIYYCVRYSFFTGKVGSSYWYYSEGNEINYRNLSQNFDGISKKDSSYRIYKTCEYDSVLIDKMNCDLFGYIDFTVKASDGNGYKYCTMISVHKHKIANLYITIFYNNRDSIVYNNVFDDAVNSIRFRQKSKMKKR